MLGHFRCVRAHVWCFWSIYGSASAKGVCGVKLILQLVHTSNYFASECGVMTRNPKNGLGCHGGAIYSRTLPKTDVYIKHGRTHENLNLALRKHHDPFL